MRISKPQRNCFRRNFSSSEGTMEISQLRSGWFLAKNIFQVPQGQRMFSTVLSGRNFLRTVFQPLRSWLISGGRSATQIAIAALALFFAVGAKSEIFAITPADSDIAITNQFSVAEMQGYKLARQILEQAPSQNVQQTGTLVIRNDQHKNEKIPLRFDVMPMANACSWCFNYVVTTRETNNVIDQERLTVIHQLNRYNHYHYDVYSVTNTDTNSEPTSIVRNLYRDQSMIPFANSDFWLCDLGLEFFHWPAQKVLPKTTKMPTLKLGREYTLLESTNPNPPTNGYSRVLSWIDKESGGLLQAEAYDATNQLLKVFEPKSYRKVNGQWQVEEIQIRNVQTDSRTRLVFDLKSH